MPWGSTDANMRAADAHYSAARQSDFDDCDQCGREFFSDDADGYTVLQHSRLFMLCEDCGDEMEDEA